jgi:HlyD family secretion protein
MRALPIEALMHLGDETIMQVGDRSFCWMYDKGNAKRIEVETGVSDGEWIEVTSRRAPGSDEASTVNEPLTPIDGSEQMILGNLSILTEGGHVKIATPSDAKKVASGNALTELQR